MKKHTKVNDKMLAYLETLVTRLENKANTTDKVLAVVQKNSKR